MQEDNFESTLRYAVALSPRTRLLVRAGGNFSSSKGSSGLAVQMGALVYILMDTVPLKEHSSF